MLSFIKIQYKSGVRLKPQIWLHNVPFKRQEGFFFEHFSASLQHYSHHGPTVHQTFLHCSYSKVIKYIHVQLTQSNMNVSYSLHQHLTSFIFLDKQIHFLSSSHQTEWHTLHLSACRNGTQCVNFPGVGSVIILLLLMGCTDK